MAQRSEQDMCEGWSGHEIAPGEASAHPAGTQAWAHAWQAGCTWLEAQAVVADPQESLPRCLKSKGTADAPCIIQLED